jgi:hypothetical protein
MWVRSLPMRRYLSRVVRETGVLSRFVMPPSNAQCAEESSDSTLRYLSDWYRDEAPEHGIQTLAFSEGRPCKGVLVVDESSANPQSSGRFPGEAAP